MGIDVGQVTIEYLPRPQGVVYEFIGELAGEAGCGGHGNSFGFYQHSDLEERAKEFARGNVLAEESLKDWIATLPWDENNYLVLTFNW